MADTKALKKVACDAIDQAAEELNEVSQEIWKHPELYYEEKYAHKVGVLGIYARGSTIPN